MSTASYNCPCCGGPLTFSGKSGKLECVSCGNSFEPEALEMLNTAESGEQIVFERPKEGFQAGEEGVQIYHCKNCGAMLMTRRVQQPPPEWPLLRQPRPSCPTVSKAA